MDTYFGPSNDEQPTQLADIQDPRTKLELLDEKISKLKDFMGQLDPYSPLSAKDKDFLSMQGITDFYDPFKITNQLIMIMEDSLEEKLRLERILDDTP